MSNKKNTPKNAIETIHWVATGALPARELKYFRGAIGLLKKEFGIDYTGKSDEETQKACQEYVKKHSL